MKTLTVRADDDVRELVMFPELSGYQLLFYSTWANETIVLEDFDILKSYPEEQVWPWCAYCQKFLHPVGAHRKSKAHRKCIKFCGLNGVEDKRRRVMQCFFGAVVLMSLGNCRTQVTRLNRQM